MEVLGNHGGGTQPWRFSSGSWRQYQAIDILDPGAQVRSLRGGRSPRWLAGEGWWIMPGPVIGWWRGDEWCLAWWLAGEGWWMVPSLLTGWGGRWWMEPGSMIGRGGWWMIPSLGDWLGWVVVYASPVDLLKRLMGRNMWFADWRSPYGKEIGEWDVMEGMWLSDWLRWACCTVRGVAHLFKWLGGR